METVASMIAIFFVILGFGITLYSATMWWMLIYVDIQDKKKSKITVDETFNEIVNRS